MKYPFYEAVLVLYKDIERCPYTFKDPEYNEWSKKDDERLFLIALDRYAEYLNGRYHIYEENIERAKTRHPHCFR